MAASDPQNSRGEAAITKQKGKEEKKAEVTLGLILQRYLIYSYAYYILDKSLVTDAQFDGLAKILLEHYDDFEHRHKHLISKDDLIAGTLYGLPAGMYPGMAVGAAKHLIKEKGL